MHLSIYLFTMLSIKSQCTVVFGNLFHHETCRGLFSSMEYSMLCEPLLYSTDQLTKRDINYLILAMMCIISGYKCRDEMCVSSYFHSISIYSWDIAKTITDKQGTQT